MKFSIIIPVYNRPNEVQELLASLTRQSYRQFEIIVVDDGSAERCEEVVEQFSAELSLSYYWKENSGPGPTRNFGAEKSSNEYIIFFDSDCIIPEHYMETVNDYLEQSPVDVFGGPDRAAASFTHIQKAINYSMTSFLTTGGIRGGQKRMDKFYPRSFNMGISRRVFEEMGGFAEMRFGEDLDLSLRLQEGEYSSALIKEAYVYHKRRTNLRAFFKQVFNSGMARYSLTLRHPGSFKLVHLLPSAFIGYLILTFVLTYVFPQLWYPLLFAIFLFAVDSLRTTRSVPVALLSAATSLVQISGYGLGLIWATIKHRALGKSDLSAFKETFYD